MIGKVVEWKMTEEERLAYIAKHPVKIKPDTDLKRKSTFVDIHTQRRREWKWRGRKAAATNSFGEESGESK